METVIVRLLNDAVRYKAMAISHSKWPDKSAYWNGKRVMAIEAAKEIERISDQIKVGFGGAN